MVIPVAGFTWQWG